MRTIFTRFYYLFTASLLSSFCYGQAPKQNPLPQVIPPSPTAAALAKYAALPVSPYTGIPKVSIPLYEIKVRDITVPISLSYHGGGGIRVDEEASWVGLGWSLNAGGVITRTVRGKDDLIGYQQTVSPVPSRGFGYSDECTIPGYNNSIDMRDASGSDNEWDPDAYFFNFLTYTGKFVFQLEFVNGSRVITPRLVEQQKLRIEYLSSGSFRLTSPDGFRYTFAAAELTNTQGFNSYNSWYITNITSPLGEEVNYIYGYGNTTTKLLTSMSVISTKAYRDAPPSLLFRDPTWTTTQVGTRYLERIEYKTGYVQFIRDQNSDREDLQGGQRLQGIRVFENGNTTPIKEFTLQTSYTTSPTEAFVSGGGTGVPNGGSSNYSVNATQHGYAAKRLQLDQVTESANGQSKPPHRFTYNSRLLPYKTSYSRDHWGLFNGAANVDLIPAYKGTQTGISNTYVELTGANREPNPTMATAGLLEAIQYPTGGTTRFTYEGNEYGNLTPAEKMRDAVVTAEVIHNWSAGQSTTPIVSRFTIPVNNGSNGSSTLMHLTVRYSSGYTTPSYQTAACGNSAIELYRIVPGQPDQFQQSWTMCNYLPTAANPSPKPADFYLPGGTYELRSRIAPATPSTTYSLFMQMQASWNQQVEETNVALLRKPGPGVRIANIIESDGNTAHDLVREYKYDLTVNADGSKGAPQGILLVHPRYDRFKQQWFYIPPQPDVNCGSPDCGQIVHMQAFQLCSSSVVQLSSAAQGSPLGYSRVEEWNGSGGVGGKTVYEYANAEDTSPPTAVGSVPTVPYALNGYLLGQTEYRRNADGSAQKLRQQNMTYTQANQFVIPGVVKELDRPNRYIWKDSWVEAFCEMPLYFYQVYTQWVQLTEKKERQYNPQDESLFQETSTHYQYDTGNKGHMQLSQSETTRSDGSKVVVKSTYPADYTSVTSGALAAMRSDAVFQHSALVESITQVYQANQTPADAVTIAGSYTEYTQPTSTSAYLPQTQQALELTQPTATLTAAAPSLPPPGRYIPKVQLSYDASANLQQAQRAQDIATTYVWGYQNTLPLASVQNATASQVQNALAALGTSSATLASVTDEQQLRTTFTQLRQRLPQARITSFTYQPLIGMTTQTRPDGRLLRYEYDSLQRLLRVRDEQNRILTQQEYQYGL
jgi:YD repeat-containing protein